jgi:hypothetical protein
MTLLHFLPDAFVLFVINAVLAAGLLATAISCFLLKYLVRLIPVASPHIRIVQIVSVAVLLVGVYLKGGHSTEMAWKQRVADVQAQLAQAEKASNDANQQLTQRTEKKVTQIQQKQVVVKQYIDREVVKYDIKFAPGGICEIPQEFINAHNTAAERIK